MSTYVYGVTRSSHPLSIDGMTGVGADASTLRLLRCGDLAAVVSDAPESLRARRRDLETHHRILQALATEGTVLPMRFGVVAPDDSTIEAELQVEADHYRGLLTRLAGKVELNVKGTHRQDAILRALLLEDETLRGRNDALRARGGGSYADQVRFGEDLAAALEDRRGKDAREVVARLELHARDTRLGAGAGGFVNASFLVDLAARQAFEVAFREVQREMSELADMRLLGPLPPYSFVSPPRTGQSWVC
jgi:Gas vesicle synthesis protein GvpL/GvpF